jgi:hypothetical protein
VPTTVSLIASASNILFGTPVILTASVIVNSGTTTPTGTVTFRTNGAESGTANVSGAGFATITLRNLPGGADNVTATYNGDPSHLTAVSNNVPFTVSGAIEFSAVSSNMGAVPVGGHAEFTVQVTNATAAEFVFDPIYVQLSSKAVPMDFHAYPACPTVLAPNARCSISFVYAPIAGDSGTQTATWSIRNPQGFPFAPANGGTITGSVATSADSAGRPAR